MKSNNKIQNCLKTTFPSCEGNIEFLPLKIICKNVGGKCLKSEIKTCLLKTMEEELRLPEMLQSQRLKLGAGLC